MLSQERIQELKKIALQSEEVPSELLPEFAEAAKQIYGEFESTTKSTPAKPSATTQKAQQLGFDDLIADLKNAKEKKDAK